MHVRVIMFRVVYEVMLLHNWTVAERAKEYISATKMRKSQNDEMSKSQNDEMSFA